MENNHVTRENRRLTGGNLGEDKGEGEDKEIRMRMGGCRRKWLALGNGEGGRKGTGFLCG